MFDRFATRWYRRFRPSPESAIATGRNTDLDWQIIGRDEPYFGVLTNDRFRRANLDDAALADFFHSGETDIAHHLERMRALFGPFAPRSALDFGCGVGRLTRALAGVTGDAVGVDISPGMLAEARRYTADHAVFLDAMPGDRRFDWVVSLIVLQHVSPEQGYGLIRDLLAAVAPGGGISLQLIIARTEEHRSAPGGRLLVRADDVGVADPGSTAAVPEGVMIMHDYDLGRVVALFFLAGMHALHLDHCDHGGAIGATLYARRPA